MMGDFNMIRNELNAKYATFSLDGLVYTPRFPLQMELYCHWNGSDDGVETKLKT